MNFAWNVEFVSEGNLHAELIKYLDNQLASRYHNSCEEVQPRCKTVFIQLMNCQVFVLRKPPGHLDMKVGLFLVFVKKRGSSHSYTLAFCKQRANQARRNKIYQGEEIKSTKI